MNYGYPTEWLSAFYFAFFIIYSRFRPFSSNQRRKVLAIGAAGILLILLTIQLDRSFSSSATSIFRNLVPALLMLFAYWQSGNFYVETSKRLQQRLLELDEGLIRICRAFYPANRWKRWIDGYLEVAYLFCYPMVPSAIAVLYLMKLDHFEQSFWLMVLPPSYACYAMVSFVQTLPPRSIEQQFVTGTEFQIIRRLNLKIIKHGSIQINTFPSAHAAASTAVALALIPIAPAVGSIFLWIAFSVAVAAAVCRYHFAADVIAGAMLSIIWFLVLNTW